MTDKVKKNSKKSVSLVKKRGATTIFIDAEIGEEGDLVLSGYELGEAPLKFLGDSDYEYWLKIPSEHKDLVLLALIKKVYEGNTSAVSEFQEFLESKKIPCKLTTYT